MLQTRDRWLGGLALELLGIGVGLAVASFFLRYAVPNMRSWVAWCGVAVGVVLMFVAAARTLWPEENFCFLEPRISNPKNLTQAVPIRIVNKNGTPIPRLEFLVSPHWNKGNAQNTEVYYSLQKNSLPIDCLGGERFVMIDTASGMQPFTLQPGKYRVEFTTQQGTGWVQTLSIEQSMDELVSVIDVIFPGNRKRYHSKRPLGYLEW